MGNQQSEIIEIIHHFDNSNLCRSGNKRRNTLCRENRNSVESVPFFDMSKAVDEIIDSLAPIKNKLDSPDPKYSELTIEDVRLKYEQLLATIRDSTSIIDNNKKILFAEASLIMKDITEQRNGEDSPLEDYKRSSNNGNQNEIAIVKPKIPVYSSSVAPILLVYGDGIVSRRVMEIADDLGKAGQFKRVDAKDLAVMQDSELKFNIRDCKSIIISADSIVQEKKGWLGIVEREEGPCPLSEKGLKRLVNAALAEINRVNTPENKVDIKVVVLGKACKPSRSVASLISGDTTSLDEEVKLLCMQRGLSYSVVKVGNIIGDNEDVPKGIRDRSEEGADSPLVFCRQDSVVEFSEFTR